LNKFDPVNKDFIVLNLLQNLKEVINHNPEVLSDAKASDEVLLFTRWALQLVKERKPARIEIL